MCEAEEGSPRVITPAQCREARKLLGWSLDLLGPFCGSSHTTIRRFEVGIRALSPERLAAIQAAFEAAGVDFTNGGEPGVKLRKAVV